MPWVRAMKDLEVRLKKLRADADDCALISKLATNRDKRELSARLAKHLDSLTSEVECSNRCEVWRTVVVIPRAEGWFRRTAEIFEEAATMASGDR